MDKNNFDQLGFPVNDNSDDFGTTRELNSIHDADSEDPSGIAPRDRFTEMNSADDPGSTRMMDSLTAPDETEAEPAANPVRKRKKRRKKKKYTNHTRTMGHVFLGVVLSVAAICVGVFLAWKVIVGLMDYTGMAKKSHEADIVIDSTMNVDDIAETLHENGIIEMPWLFKTYINMKDEAEGFLDGEYTVNSTMSYSNIITLLKTVRQYTNTVTVMIPEGYNAQQIGQLLEENLVCRADDFEKYYRSKLEKYDFEEQITVTENRFYALEGYLFPDTYDFYIGDEPGRVITKFLDDFDYRFTDKMKDNLTKLQETMAARLAENGYSEEYIAAHPFTLREVMIVASMVQQEAYSITDSYLVSSVIYNRLADPDEYPFLNIDAALLYVLRGERTDLTAEDLQMDSPYNTYNHVGLTPGPICNPGRNSIYAALEPQDTNYHYYALEKGTDEHHFSETLSEHEAFLASQENG